MKRKLLFAALAVSLVLAAAAAGLGIHNSPRLIPEERVYPTGTRSIRCKLWNG